MSQITVTLPDKSTRNFNPGVTPFEIAESIGARLANDALAAQVNSKLVDLNVPIETHADVAIFSWPLPPSIKIKSGNCDFSFFSRAYRLDTTSLIEAKSSILSEDI